MISAPAVRGRQGWGAVPEHLDRDQLWLWGGGRDVRVGVLKVSDRWVWRDSFKTSVCLLLVSSNGWHRLRVFLVELSLKLSFILGFSVRTITNCICEWLPFGKNPCYFMESGDQAIMQNVLKKTDSGWLSKSFWRCCLYLQSNDW